MNYFFGLLVLSLSFTAVAEGKKGHQHHDAHVHGEANLNIAIDQLSGIIEFKAAAEAVVGFEHAAKSEKDKRKLALVIKQFEDQISKMIVFDVSSDCVIAKDKIELKVDGSHADFLANFNINCKKPLLGTKITFDFTSWKALKDIDGTILIGDLQKSIEIKKVTTVELK